MIDHLLGRPSAAFKRTQTFLVLLFWAVFILKGDRNGPPLVRWFSNKLRGKLTPWQVLAGTLTCLYAIKNADSVLGLQAPEPLARLYSRDFYRATWIAVALDTGHASAMHVRPKWLRHFLSMLFSGYYLVFAHEADEKLRKYRAVCTVELLRATWEKTSNPIIRLVTALRTPKVQIKRKILLPRPRGSPYSKPVVAWLYFAGSDEELERSKDLMLDLPGGGFVCMDPSHHDERLHHWTIRTGKPLLAVDYAKAPEYPYPYAMHECFDVYRLLHETKGSVIGFRSGEIRIVVSGDSAGANIGAAMMIKLLEMPAASRPPLPLSLIWTYPALDFNFTSFMPPEHLRILRQESSSTLRGIAEQKDHLKHQSPLAVVEDESDLRQRRRRSSWAKSFSKLPFVQGLKSPGALTPSSPAAARRGALLPLAMTPTSDGADAYPPVVNDTGHEGDTDGEGEELVRPKREREKSLSERVQYWNPDRGYAEMNPEQLSALSGKQSRSSAIGTRLTMTSRTGFFNDRIISPSMMRAMAICYVGPRNSPDLSKNYYISPILTPANLLAQYPHVYLLCGERDPFSDDTLIFSGRLRDAKLERKAELQAKQNKFGEGLRMSNANPSNRDPILDETEDDWVTMRFIEGWSHGFMQMATLLPKVMHFYDLTADWASFSFTKYEAQQRHPDSIINAVQVPTVSYPEPGQDSTASEKEEEVLSFKPRRRGSRTSSPAPGSGAGDVPTSGSIRAQLRQDMQQGLNANSADAAALDLGASSSSGSERNNSPASTAATSMASLNGTNARLRRASPGEGPGRMGPVERVLREEADVLPGFAKQTSGGGRRASESSNVPSASHVRSGSGSSLRRGSDVAENAVAASAFVEAHDLLKRRREDAVAGLTGSAVLSSSESDEERKKQTRKKESQRGSTSQSHSAADRDAGLLDALADPAVP